MSSNKAPAKAGDLESRLAGYWVFDAKKMAEITGNKLDPREQASLTEYIAFEFRNGKLITHRLGVRTSRPHSKLVIFV